MNAFAITISSTPGLGCLPTLPPLPLSQDEVVTKLRNKDEVRTMFECYGLSSSSCQRRKVHSSMASNRSSLLSSMLPEVKREENLFCGFIPLDCCEKLKSLNFKCPLSVHELLPLSVTQASSAAAAATHVAQSHSVIPCVAEPLPPPLSLRLLPSSPSSQSPLCRFHLIVSAPFIAVVAELSLPPLLSRLLPS
ncbi:uncharacterized protein DS421_1g15420 [Arachis hypogaea]|nr:uncharacterized protein DS421_1g15420 [Arachis hypogaea]